MKEAGNGCDCAEKLQELVESVGRKSSQIKNLAENQKSVFLRMTMANHFVVSLMEKRVLPELSEANMKCGCIASNAIREILNIIEKKNKSIFGKKSHFLFPKIPRKIKNSFFIFS